MVIWEPSPPGRNRSFRCASKCSENRSAASICSNGKTSLSFFEKAQAHFCFYIVLLVLKMYNTCSLVLPTSPLQSDLSRSQHDHRYRKPHKGLIRNAGCNSSPLSSPHKYNLYDDTALFFLLLLAFLRTSQLLFTLQEKQFDCQK